MQRFLKIVFLTSISILGLWIVVAILGLFIPLECTNNDIKDTYITIYLCVFPIAVLFAIIGTIKTKDNERTVAIKTCLAIGAFFYSAIMMVAVLIGSSVCGWINEEVLFENKKNPSTQILQRSYDGGAWDSSPSNPKMFIIREFTPYFIWATEIDTNQIDKNEWIRVENSETENINKIIDNE